jgi:hypothetical protein
VELALVFGITNTSGDCIALTVEFSLAVGALTEPA